MYRKLIFICLIMIVLAANCSWGYSGSTETPSADKSITPNLIQRINLTEDLYLRQIGDGVFVVTHVYPWPANSLLVEMSNGSLVIAGSTYTPEALQVVLKWAKSRFGQRPVIDINTGYHIDNLGGNKTLLAAKIPVYGSDLSVKLLQERSESTRQLMLKLIGDSRSKYYKTYSEIKFYPPDHLFPISEGLTLTFNSEKVEVIYPGPSQAPDKVAVYFPSRKLLFGSCMVLGGDTVGNVAEADFKQCPDAIRKLSQFPVDLVIPGHGDRLDPGLIQHTSDLLLRK